jgi:dTDP-4-amino-4,6-dideoxygalactose transaminase
MKKKIPCIEGGAPIRRLFLSFSPPTIGKAEIDEVVDTLKSGWITTGPKVKKFEEKFSQYVKSKYAIALSSCTDGLFLSLLALGIKEGDEVITTPYTFAATSNVILHCRAKPIFVDIVPETLNIDPRKIASKISSKTKGIIPVHFGGRPCEMNQLLSIARRFNLWMVEDAAHAVGTLYKGQFVGTFGDITAFSFHAVKNLTTAEGGMITTENKSWADFIRINRIHGMNKDAWRKQRSWFYEIIYPGYKCNMTDIQAALGIHQLERLEEFIERRRTIARIYEEKFSKIEEIELFAACINGRNTYHLFLIKLLLDKLKISRDNFIQAMFAENIAVNVHYIPIHYHPYYKKKFGYRPGSFPVAEKIFSRVVSLPIYPKMTDDEVMDVVNAVNKLIEYYRKEK